MKSPLPAVFRRQCRADASGRGLVYLSLQRALAEVVESGALRPGDALPGERVLAEQLGVSRVTVRRAIAGLIANGLLIQRRGAGTFVAERIVKSFSRLTSFSDDLRARGLDSRSRFLERTVGAATPEEAMGLDLSPGAAVVRLYRLRFAGERPLVVERTAVPHALLADPASVGHSLYDALEREGHVPVRALQRVRAVALDAGQARLLELPAGSPALYIERRAYLADGRAVEFTRSFYRGDVYDFVAELGR